MTAKPKILADECLSRPAITGLLGILSLTGIEAELAHLADVYGVGQDDTVWIPKAAQDGWFVLTSDRGMHSRVQERLPLLCEAFGVPHALIGAGLNKRKMAFKVLKIQLHWEGIVAAASAGIKGARYGLQLTGETSSKFDLIRIPTAEDIAKTQQILEVFKQD